MNIESHGQNQQVYFHATCNSKSVYQQHWGFVNKAGKAKYKDHAGTITTYKPIDVVYVSGTSRKTSKEAPTTDQ
tara:strand:- start:235 stop:456 length:222 start_codon:yes stop_codon:yes gene_type:complete